jgi:hypothetical protein
MYLICRTNLLDGFLFPTTSEPLAPYNEKTKQIEWGTKAPDGRDLKELSTEELIRLLNASSVNATTDGNGTITTPDGLKWRREGDLLVPADRPPK